MGSLQIGSIATVMLFLSWVILVVSSGAGIWTQLGITSVLEPPGQKPDPYNPTIRNPKIIFPFQIQLVTLGAGVLFLVVYGVITILGVSQTT